MLLLSGKKLVLSKYDAHNGLIYLRQAEQCEAAA
jgi:hypothetical protein